MAVGCFGAGASLSLLFGLLAKQKPAAEKLWRLAFKWVARIISYRKNCVPEVQKPGGLKIMPKKQAVTNEVFESRHTAQESVKTLVTLIVQHKHWTWMGDVKGSSGTSTPTLT